MSTTKTTKLDKGVWHKHWVGRWGHTFYETEGTQDCKYVVRNDYIWRSYQYYYDHGGWHYSRFKPTSQQLVYPYNKIDESYDDKYALYRMRGMVRAIWRMFRTTK